MHVIGVSIYLCSSTESVVRITTLKDILISLITGWTVYTEKYKARGPDV